VIKIYKVVCLRKQCVVG